MKLKIKQLPQLATGLSVVLTLKMAPELALRLAMFARVVQEKLEVFDERRRALAKQYGEPSPEGGYKFSTGRANEEFSEAVEKTAAAEVELPDVTQIKLSDFPKDTEKLGELLFNLDVLLEQRTT